MGCTIEIATPMGRKTHTLRRFTMTRKYDSPLQGWVTDPSVGKIRPRWADFAGYDGAVCGHPRRGVPTKGLTDYSQGMTCVSFRFCGRCGHRPLHLVFDLARRGGCPHPPVWGFGVRCTKTPANSKHQSLRQKSKIFAASLYTREALKGAAKHCNTL